MTARGGERTKRRTLVYDLLLLESWGSGGSQAMQIVEIYDRLLEMRRGALHSADQSRRLGRLIIPRQLQLKLSEVEMTCYERVVMAFECAIERR